MNGTMPPEVRSGVEARLDIKINAFTPVGGGCINHGGKLITSVGDYFVKWNDRDKYPDMFATEFRGLELLRSSDCIPIPRPIACGETETKQFIVMEWAAGSKRRRSFWHDLGASLAALHRHRHTEFGLDHDNYIGSLKQCNHQHNDWYSFFIEQRLEPQLQLLQPDNSLRKAVDKLAADLENVFPVSQPSLLHGDLWSGNVIVGSNGDPCLIDPAVHYGNRESELAFTRLFGGFDADFYSSYNETFPLDAGFEERIDILNLYPLLVHANLFGGHYIAEIRAILRPWS